MSYWYCPQCKRELDGCNVTYHENCAICGARVLSIDEGITPERLTEILAAEREGRCVVLPCKVGDEVWILAKGAFVLTGPQRGWEFRVEKRTYGHWLLDYYEFGKTVFPTRAEAVAALRQKGDDDER